MAYGRTPVGATGKKRSKREPFSRGFRLLSADKAHHEALLAALQQNERVKPYSYGANRFDDREGFPFYVFVTRTADGKPLGKAECELLDALLVATDRTAPLEPQPEQHVAVETEVTAEQQSAPVEADGDLIGSRFVSLEQQVRDATGRLVRLNRAVEELEQSLSRGFDKVMQSLASELQVLASDQVRERAEALAKGDRALVDQLVAEYEAIEKKERALAGDVERLKQERDRLQERITELELELAEREHDLSVSRSTPREAWTRDELDLLEILGSFAHTERFRRALRELVPEKVSTHSLVAVLRSLVERSVSTHHECANTKHIGRKGKSGFYELRCNLGPCGDDGRVYYDVRDGRNVLLGFGTKDTQPKDIEALLLSR